MLNELAADLFRTYLEESEVTYEFAIRKSIRDIAKNILNYKCVEELKENTW